jgi:signal transduction histidine kinase
MVDMLNISFDKIQTQTKILKQFISDVSHEFKTPLMIINSKIDFFTKK